MGSAKDARKLTNSATEQPKTLVAIKIKSTRLWRELIQVLLLLAALASFLGGIALLQMFLESNK